MENENTIPEEIVADVDARFTQLAQELQTMFKPYEKTPAALSASQAVLRLQEAHMWTFNGINTVGMLGEMAEQAAEQAVADGTLVNMTGDKLDG
jgi:hypothetical protein